LNYKKEKIMSIFDKKESRQITKREFEKARAWARKAEEKDNLKSQRDLESKWKKEMKEDGRENIRE
jgi:hypothetical protein